MRKISGYCRHNKKKAAAKKENEVHDTRNNAKDQTERKNAAAAAAEAESTPVETVAQETEGRSTMRSSTVTNQRGAAEATEAESTHVDTVAQETEGRSTKRSKADNQRVVLLISSIDVRTGGRLHPVGVMMKRKAVSVIRLQGSDCRTNAHTHS